MKSLGNNEKKYSKTDIKKIRKKAHAIWQRKHQSLSTALDDWLQAEQELKSQNEIAPKSSDRYTDEDIAKIKKRAQAVRDHKVGSLRTAFNDWIEAEQDFKKEMKGKVQLNRLFNLWFDRMSPPVVALLEEHTPPHVGTFDDVMGKHYIDLMAECMK